MATGPDTLIQHLRRTAAAPALAGLADGQLLRQFAAGGPAAGPAFEALLRRHGPMVWRACRASLRDSTDAEDAFQATFLLLVRKAGELRRPDALGPWLFGVARRVSARARADALRRREHECRAAGAVEAPTAEDRLEWDLVALVHDEVGRLPEGLRAAVVLCDLEGLTYQDVAQRLGWTHATVRGRLARARMRLRERLARRGLGPEALALAPVAVPRPLVVATARAASAIVLGESAGVPGAILALMNGGLQSMIWTKFKTVGLSLLAAGMLFAGAFGLSAQAPKAADPVEAWQHAAVSEVLLMDLAIQVASPADRITRLAQEARRLEEAGDVEGALKVLRQLDEAAWAWQGGLRQKRVGRAADPAAQPEQPAQPHQKGVATTWRLEKRAWEEVPHTRPQPVTPKGSTGEHGESAPVSRTRPADADLESRLREVEQKLDRLLKALDSRPGTPTNAPATGRP